MEYKNDIMKRPDDDYGCGKNGCDRECSIHTNVKLPVEFEPEANVGKIEIECCGDPEIKCECNGKGGIDAVIFQNVFVKIPICYDVKVKTGRSQTDCKCSEKR